MSVPSLTLTFVPQTLRSSLQVIRVLYPPTSSCGKISRIRGYSTSAMVTFRDAPLRNKKISLIVLLTTLLLLRQRILRRTKNLVSKSSSLSVEELAAAAQQVYTNNSDGSKTLLVPFRGRISKVHNYFTDSRGLH